MTETHPALAHFPLLCSEPAWTFVPGGGVIDIAAPHPDKVCFLEMATSLSRINRFDGRGIPVAQHLVMGADAILSEYRDKHLAALYFLHDGHEWIFGDQSRPTMKLLDRVINRFLPPATQSEMGLASMARRTIAGAWDHAIYRAADKPDVTYWTEQQRDRVKAMDERMLRAEAIAAFGADAAKELPNSKRPTLRGAIHPWGGALAELKFIDMAKELLGEDVVARQRRRVLASRKGHRP